MHPGGDGLPRRLQRDHQHLKFSFLLILFHLSSNSVHFIKFISLYFTSFYLNSLHFTSVDLNFIRTIKVTLILLTLSKPFFSPTASTPAPSTSTVSQINITRSPGATLLFFQSSVPDRHPPIETLHLIPTSWRYTSMEIQWNIPLPYPPHLTTARKPQLRAPPKTDQLFWDFHPRFESAF